MSSRRELPKHILAVSCLITRENGDVLLVLHPRRGWEFPGGQVEEGETLLDALHREIAEETGVDIEVGKLVGVYTNIKPPARLIFGFVGSWKWGEPITSDESLETEWVPRAETLERVTQPAIYGRMKDMLEFQDRIIYRVYTTDRVPLLISSLTGLTEVCILIRQAGFTPEVSMEEQIEGEMLMVIRFE